MLGLWQRWQWNRFVNALEVFFGRARLRSRPWFVQMESTSRCNLRCIQCSRQKLFGKGEDLDLEVLDRVDRELLPWAREFYTSFYGEPLLYPHFDKVLAVVKRHPHLRSGFFTHGLLLTEKRIDEILDAGVSFLHVSIDGATPETYEAIRIGAKFDRLTACLETLSRKRREWEARGGRHLEVQIRVVGMRQNIEEAPLFVEMAHRYGFDAVGYYVNMTVDDEAMTPHALNRFPGLTNRMFREAHRRAIELGVTANFGTIPFPPREDGGADGNTDGNTESGAGILPASGASGSHAQDGQDAHATLAPDPPSGGCDRPPSELPADTPGASRPGPWARLAFGARLNAARSLAGDSALLGAALLTVKAVAKTLNPRWGERKPEPNAYAKERCGTPWSYVIVKADGELQPCCFLSRPMGNLKTQRFMEAWNGPEYVALRRSLASRRYRNDCERATCNYISGEENLKYGYEWVEAPSSLEAQTGETKSARVAVRNTGTMTWEVAANDPTHWVSLGYHVLDSQGRAIADMGHVPLQHPAPPGDTAAFDLPLPTALEAGDYVLRLDMVHEAITWFRDRGQQARGVPFSLR